MPASVPSHLHHVFESLQPWKLDRSMCYPKNEELQGGELGLSAEWPEVALCSLQGNTWLHEAVFFPGEADVYFR